MYRLAFILSFVALMLMTFTIKVDAEQKGRVFNVPIAYTTSAAVTALDFTVSISGGVLQSLRCGSDEFIELKKLGNRCITFNPQGKMNGVIALAEVVGAEVGRLEVSVRGEMSTSQGEPPATAHFNGGIFTIVDHVEQDDIMGDINGDRTVSVLDLGFIASHYSKKEISLLSASELQRSDFNKDGVINIFDLGRFMSFYRR